MCTIVNHFNACTDILTPGLYVPSTKAEYVPSYPFTLKQYPLEKKQEGRSIDMTFESSVFLLVKELSQPSCLEPYSMWQNFMLVC